MRYTEIKPKLDEQVLDEVKMSPSALQKFANSPEAEGMLVGIEFEMGVPNVEEVDEDPNWEYDYDMDERARSIDDIIDFFRNGEFSNMGRSSADRARSEMYEQYQEWVNDRVGEAVRNSDQLDDLIRDKLREDYISVDDYMDEAREDLGDEAPGDAVQSRAIKLMDEAIDEMIEERTGRDYDSAFDDAIQELEDDLSNSADYDEEEWLRDIGIDYMSEAEREWSFEWPHMIDTNEGSSGGEDLDSLADEFSQAMGGVKVNTSGGYHGATRDGRSWIIEPDGSIDANRGDAGLEFVSPPMPLQQGLATLQQFYAWAKKRGCYTNDSTGLHMNISVPDMSTETLDYVKLALFMGDEYILKQFGRQYNSYCKSAMSKIKDRIRPEDVPAVLNTVKQNLNSLASKIIHSGITEKYTSINTRGQYVEFRGPGGDYLDSDPLDLVNTALRLAMSLRIATNPESYKQEYAKKLYKLVEQSPDADDSVELFSQYAMGQINKGELAARLQFAQRSRKIEKTKPQVKRLIDEPGVRDQINKFPGLWRDTFNNLRNESNEELQELEKNFSDLGEYYYFTKEQGQLALALIANELESRSTQGEKQQYWVTRRDGDGGKQMVLARNENEAILLGGKNIGLNRQQSISQLRAKEKVPYADDAAIQASLPGDWKDFDQRIEDASLGLLRGNFETLNNRRWDHRNLDDEQVIYLLKRIQQQMSASSDQPSTQTNTFDRKTYPAELKTMIEELPDIYRNWVLNIPNKEEDLLRGMYRNVTSSDYYNQIPRNQANVIANLINHELSYRSATGTEEEDGSIQLQFNDAVPANADDTSSTEMPPQWTAFFDAIADATDMTLIGLLRNTGANDAAANMSLTDQQLAQIRIAIKRELRRRGVNPDADAAPSDAAVAQQTQLIQRDDPVTSNDPEANDGPGTWLVGNHTYGRETLGANSRDDAIARFARQLNINIADVSGEPGFVAQLQEPAQQELDLQEMRRLAGLI